MGHEIMYPWVLRRSKGRIFVLDPFLCTHVAHAVKMRAFLYHDDGTLDVTNQNAGLLEFHLLLSADRAFDTPANCDRTGRDHALDDRAFPDNNRTTGVNFPFDTAVNANSAVERDDPLETCALAEKCEFIIFRNRLFFCVAPHQHPPSQWLSPARTRPAPPPSLESLETSQA